MAFSGVITTTHGTKVSRGASDAEGWAEFLFQAFGKGAVVVRAKGFARTKLDWAKGEEELEIFLEPESTLTGTVLDETGKSVSGGRIVLSWGAGETMNIAIGEKDGRYRANGLRSGTYAAERRAHRRPESLSQPKSCWKVARRSSRTSVSSEQCSLCLALRKTSRSRSMTNPRNQFR